MNATGQRDASDPRPAPEAAPAGVAPLRVRWGRVAVALAGVAGLGLFVVVGIVALFGAVPGAVPLLGLAAFVLAVAGLRALAVRDRRRRVLERINRTYADAMEAAQEQVAREQEQAETPSRARGGELFDGQPGQTERRAPTVQELREEARRVAARDAADQRTGRPVADTRTWTPVDVPTPTYVKAAKAERPEPAPMPRPEERRAQFVTSILADTRAQAAHTADAAAASGSLPSGSLQSGTAQPGPAQDAPAASGAPRINLDDVLQRRRGA